jgi:hypothetical protein
MFRNLKVDKHLKPGQKGTKALVEKYGDSLLCVRYRKDAGRKVRVKTVEIIVEEKEYMSGSLPYRDEDIVQVMVAFSEKTLRSELKAVGGKWDSEERIWHIPYGAIRGNEQLEKRILDPD